MSFQIERGSFFKGPKGETLKFKECSPESPCKEHYQCNCTKVVTERPLGDPFEVYQSINYTDTFSDYNLKWCLNRSDFDLYFYWDEKPYEEGFRWQNPHAYFSFDRTKSNMSRNSISIGVSPKHHEGLDDMDTSLLTDMYFGNKIDISHMFNGHSPSRIVKLEDISPDDVWLHYSIGGEAMDFFSPSEEAKMWKGIYKEGLRVMEITDPYIDDQERTVSEIRSSVVTNLELLGLVDSLKRKLVGVLDNLQETELYRRGNKVSQTVRASW